MVEARGAMPEQQIGLPFSVRFAHRFGTLTRWDAPVNWARRHAEAYFNENHPELERGLNEAIKAHENFSNASERVTELEQQFAQKRTDFEKLKYDGSPQETEAAANELGNTLREWQMTNDKMLAMRQKILAHNGAFPLLYELTSALNTAASIAGTENRKTQAQRNGEKIQRLIDYASNPIEIDEAGDKENMAYAFQTATEARKHAQEKYAKHLEKGEKPALEGEEPETGEAEPAIRAPRAYEPAAPSHLPLFNAANTIHAASFDAASALATALARQGRTLKPNELAALRDSVERARRAHGKVQRSAAQGPVARRYRSSAAQAALRLAKAVREINSKLRLTAGKRLEFAT